MDTYYMYLMIVDELCNKCISSSMSVENFDFWLGCIASYLLCDYRLGFINEKECLSLLDYLEIVAWDKVLEGKRGK